MDTHSKLFCDCPTILSTEPPTLIVERRLRPTQSELGQIDPAVLFEFPKGRTIKYEADPETTDLVELAEAPPHRLNEESIETALTFPALFTAPPLHEIPP